ncbi:MAG: ATPase domain-containing protein [SAR202 cluster bacterium]|jgi:archaellum biogenesis ATPase FlaH|nr:ATPase domain-containing protein [SAR202 cluster bacterium]MDP7534500.1 ATPase domain-containing protein [SAR202 cluster bacterium]|tara:strand:+ start:192 stop:422 length:231 start_codon:yes stop_codon:yes gene_type:complete
MSDYDVGESVIRTGHEYLDLVLNGGIHLPSLTLIEGDVQTGKGTLAQSISNEALQEGNGVTYFTSENSPKAIVEQM